MFKRIDEQSGDSIAFLFDGTVLHGIVGDTVATALLASGVRHFGTTQVSGSSRAPFCMMGACYDCLVLIDGQQVQACMMPLVNDMIVQRIDQV